MRWDMNRKDKLKEINTLVSFVPNEYLETLRWTVQQFAAEGMNKAMKDARNKANKERVQP